MSTSSLPSIETLLEQDPYLQSISESVPQAYEIPYKRSETKKFVIIWIHLRERCLSHQNIVNAIKTIIRSVVNNVSLGNYEGIEVVPYFGENVDGSGRVVRVSVEKSALTQVLMVPTADFRGKSLQDYSGWYAKPIDGVYVSWYKNPTGIID